MRFHLDKAKEHVEDGLQAQEAGRLTEARYHYLKAAEYMVQAAERTENRAIAARRLEYARQLQGKAEALEPLIRAAEARQRALPIAAEGQEVAWLVAERPTTRFDDVAGLDDVKEQIRLKLIYPFTHPEQAERFGIRQGGGLLLYGPPGTGKTLIARAVAGEVDAAFFTVKPSEIMSKWVGEAEQNVARLFALARAEPRSVIFIDEVEALVPKRRGSSSTVMQRVVPQFLAELEGFDRHEDEGALLFVGATNEPWALDPAVMRPGRFDEKIYVPLPDLEARRRILELNLKDRPLAADVGLDELAERLAGYSGADVVNVCRKACAIPFLEAVEEGVERDVGWLDFEAVMEQVRPSVSAKDMKRFEQFREGT
jgi:transitional endoplasmic reticulum ATPase